MKNTALLALIKQLDYTFQAERYLNQALTHRSASTSHNERLEFLGDAVLNLVIADELLKRYPTLAEGKLSPMRAALVKGETLAEIAKALNLGPALKLGLGEQKTGGAKRTSILADALEALFGAIYLDGGFDAAKKIILKLYDTRLQTDDIARILEKDAKTTLQEYTQAQKISLPCYTLTKREGKDHAQQFHITCYIESINDSTKAVSTTRRKAEQLAASAMLKKLRPIEKK